jgi:GntR family transcriptional repressor for pyruvate dehydrogenase complex
MFNEVRQHTVSERIVEQVKELILQGKLRPGQKLPSERQLADQLGVGRSSVREAASAMVALGIVEIRPGDGAYIRSDFPSSMLESLAWSSLLLNGHSNNLVEARVILERATASLAAQRATTEDRQRLCDLVVQMESAATLDTYIELDLKFHVTLAESSQNHVLRDIIASIQRLIRDSMAAVLQSEEMYALSLQHHRSLSEAINRGDAAEAESLMVAHLRKDADFFAKLR